MSHKSPQRIPRLAATLLCAAAGSATTAAGLEPLPLTLDQTLERALASAPVVDERRSERIAAAAALREARAERLPRLDFDAAYTRFSDIRVFSVPGRDGTPQVLFPNLPNRGQMHLGLGAPLYAGGRLARSIDAAALQNAAAAQEVRAAQADVLYETTASYWSLATAIESEAVLREALASFEAHLGDAKNRHEQGLAARNEVLAVQVERDRAELRRLEAEHAAARAQAELGWRLELPPGQHIDPVEPLEAPLEGRVLETPALEHLLTTALESRPERAAIQARVAAADALIGVQRAARLPQVNANAGFLYANPNFNILPPQPEWEDTWSVSVQLHWNVLDGGRASAAVARAQAQAASARHRLDALDREVQLQVTRSHLELRTARATLPVAERNVEAALENRRVARERYQAGVLPSSERLDAEIALLQAGLELTVSRARVRMALATLERAIGQ
jgi:outer membrane protein TolC